MKNGYRILAGSLLAGAAAFAVATPAWTQGQSGPVARYTMDAGTSSGMAAMGAGGSGIGAALGALGGGGPQVAHELFLRLGSSRAPDGEARGEHFMPEGARLGRSVPLQTPRVVDDAGEQGSATGAGAMQMPQGRLLLFWGCGETAGPGQPVVIDFSKMARGEVPPGLFAAMNDMPEAWRIHSGNSRTYGEWPHSLDDQRVQPNSSLLGVHRISSSYAPDISFTLADDFMPALQPVTRDLPSGAVSLSWNALDKANGYYAWVMATGAEGGNARDMVWWSSSATQQFGGPMSDWLTPAAVRRLVNEKTVMPAHQTACTIPAEVKAMGGPMLMTQLFAYGPQVDFSYPERPRAAPASWSPEWIARVRFRSSAMVMHGLPGMSGMAGPQSQSESETDSETAGGVEEAPQAPALPRCRGGLRGIAERAAGLCQ